MFWRGPAGWEGAPRWEGAPPWGAPRAGRASGRARQRGRPSRLASDATEVGRGAAFFGERFFALAAALGGRGPSRGQLDARKEQRRKGVAPPAKGRSEAMGGTPPFD